MHRARKAYEGKTDENKTEKNQTQENKTQENKTRENKTGENVASQSKKKGIDVGETDKKHIREDEASPEYRQPREETQPEKQGKKHEPETDEKDDWKSISDAADLLDEVKDIRDELTILKAILTQQDNVWSDVHKVPGQARTERRPHYMLTEINEMIEITDSIKSSVSRHYYSTL